MQIRKQTKHADSLSQKIDRLERQIDQLRCGLEYDNVKRNISIIVDAEVAAPSEFHVSYQVYCASWKPSYDIRVSTANDKKETTSLTVYCASWKPSYDIRVSTANDKKETTSLTMCYYGVIEQNTGEDWKASELVLSTATPSIGGCVPPLSTLAASFRPRNDGQRKSSWKRKPTSATNDEDMGFGSFDYNELADAAALQRLTACAAQPNSDLQYSSATSYEHLPSTCFAIAHPATILGDGSDHKVTIVKFEMDAKFIHETVPARAAAAYMTALATNTSSLPLLSGPAAVYLNNSFVSKMQLELVLPGEEFYCNLGVDPSLKIEYKAATSIHEQMQLELVLPGEEFYCNLGVDPSLKIEYKAATSIHEQIGFVSKCMLQTHDHVIGVRNAKANQQVQLTVKEHVPKAFDEKIKICVISPDLRSTKAEAYLNEDNNLEWTLCLQPGEQRDLHIKWSIEYPLHETVTYKQIYSVLYV
uniref:DUF4139 domain-containing protein n=1 Tax=Ascaris lumbricoides TaxID=6252 RepID=A0A0M3IQP6_ASCLU